jgi:CRP/FNR family transcriptional regulator
MEAADWSKVVLHQDIPSSAIPKLCLACEGRRKGVCGALEAPQLARLGRHSIRREVAPGTELLAAGEQADSYANILSGVVKLYKLMSDGRRQLVGLQFAPDFLGRPFADRGEVTAEAANLVRICSFPRSVLEAVIRESPGLERRLHEQALRELDEARDWMMTLGRKSAAEKVASFLRLVGRHVDPSPDGYATQFEIPLERADIADFLGLTIETVSRQLTLLRKAGVIDIVRNRQVTVNDLPSLVSASGV